MNTAEPIRDPKDLMNFKNYFKYVKPHPRNYLLIALGLNTALRISDILELRWDDVCTSDFRYVQHIIVKQKKTGKSTVIYLNQNVHEALAAYEQSVMHPFNKFSYIFKNSKGKPISRIQAYRIITEAAEYCHIEGVISPHSLRKTFGYYAWKQGVQPALLQELYQHSSYAITKRYLGIDQDELDEVYKRINL